MIDESTPSADINPYDISIYTLKELIWRDWRDEWEARPSNPGSIRLITMGRMLDDKSSLHGEHKISLIRLLTVDC